MAFELSRVDRLTKTYDLAARFPELDGPFTAAEVALLPPRSAPTGATLWDAVGVTAGIATVLFAGPDADSSGAVVVTGSADLWLRVAVGSEVDAAKAERITLLGGGTVIAPGPLPQVLSVQGRTGAVVLDAADVGAPTTTDLSNGLATKVNSSTYTAGLAGKADRVGGVVPDAQLPTRLSDTELRAAFGLVENVRWHGATGDGTTDDTAAIQAAIAAAAANKRLLYFPAGTYLTDHLTVPAGVWLLGEGATVTTLRNTATDGQVYVHFLGSNSGCQQLTIDGQRAAQATTGLAAVQFARPNNATAGGDLIAGGVVLGAGLSAGATSLTVNTATPGGEAIRAGEVITLVEGVKYEMVRVAPSYSGGTTIPLTCALSQAFTTAAKVSVASTDVGISQCTVLSNGRDGVAFWHVIYGYARFNRVRDCQDTAIDLPDAGSRFVDVHQNDIETNGRWGVSLDTQATQFGRTADCPVTYNVIRLLPGGDDDQRDGLFIGHVDRCPNTGNTVDLSLAGVAGVQYAESDTTSSPTVDITVIGNVTPRAGTYGVRTPGAHLRGHFVRGGSIWGLARGIDLNTCITGGVIGTEINNISDPGPGDGYALNMLADDTVVQAATVLNVVADGNVAAVRFGGTANAGSKAVVNGCVLTNSSFDTVTADAGWTLTETNNIP